MDDQSDDDLTLSIVQEDDSKPLSPIVEMDESTEVQYEEFVMDIEDDLKLCNKVDAKLNLETSVENQEDRLSQPETPPEVLRIRLNSLQSDYEELKEFTDLERQVIHSDCIPRDEVQSLEEEFFSLNEKVQHLMQENSEYQRKLVIKEDEIKNLKSEMTKSVLLQNEIMILIEQMTKKLKEDIKDASIIKEIELLPPSFLEKCGENVEVSHIQSVDKCLNSLRGLNDLLKITTDEKQELQDKVEHLQLNVLELNETVKRVNREVTVYQQSLKLVKSDCVNFQEKLVNIDKELAEISMALSASEEKRLEEKYITDFINKELDNTQEQILSIITMLENFVHSLYDDSDNSFVTHENLAALEKNLRNSRDLFGVLSTLDILEQIFHKLKREVKCKKEECYELQLNIQQLNDHLRKYEEDVSERKVEIEFLQQEINERIPSRLLELKNCLGSKDSEILRLKSNLKAAYAKVDELSNKLSESRIKMDQMEVLSVKNSLEKTNLENEIFKLNDCLTIDNIQNHIILAVKCLEHVIDSWDEKSNLGDLITALQEKEDIPNVTNLLMNFNTRVISSEIAKKYKQKLLLHDKETNTLYSKLKTVTSEKIDYLEIENEKIRLEVNTLDHIIREGISNRVNDLEKLLNCSDKEKLVHESTKQYTYGEDKYPTLVIPEEHRQKEDLNPLKATYISCDKRQKQINNFNKVTKPDDGLEKNIYDLNEIENLIDSWDCSGKIQVSEFIQLLHEKLLKYCDNYQNSKVKVDISRIINKFEGKLMELFELNNQLLKTVKSVSNFVEDNENKQVLYTCTIEDMQWMRNALKEKETSVNDNCEKKHDHDETDEIKTIKQLMCVEITSLDETEDKGSLMCDSVENIFSKLMQIIMIKEQEMSYSLQKQQNEEVHNFEQTIEKLANKLKSQESWTNALECENEKINTELIALKSLNNSFDQKVKALSNVINTKTLELDIMKKKLLDLTTENYSLISELDEAKDLINKYINSISCLEKDIEKLNEDIVNKSNVIKHLESKLISGFDEQEHLDSKINILSSNSMSIDAKKDSVMVGVNQTNDSKFSNVITEGCSSTVKSQKENIFDFETGLSETLRKETSFINDMLKRGGKIVPFSELLSRCHENLFILKDLIQNIGSKISELEISHIKDLQSIQTALEYKTKEMLDFKLSISKLHWDLVPNRVEMRKGFQIELSEESFQHCSITSIQNEVDQIKSECFSFSNRVDEFENLAKVGQNIVQNLRDAIQTIADENNNKSNLILDLRKSIECEQDKVDQQKQIANKFAKENKVLIEQNYLLENEIRDLKLELSQLKREMFLGLDICFPDKIETSEKVTYINNTLKQYAETQEVCYIVTEELRFFGYHFELMLSYIQSLEYKMYFTTKQKEHVEKENTLLKGQLTTQHLEMNRFFNQLISKSPYVIKTQNQALEVISHIFSEYKLTKENNVKLLNEDKLRQENILQLQKELISLTKQNSSLKFELTKCEDSIRNLRSELRNARSKCQKKENINVDFTEVKQEKIDVTVQTDGSCCKRLQKKIMEQKEKIDILAAKLSKNESHQRSSLTSNPHNKQVSYLEGALGQAKERIGRLHFELKQQESHNQELVEALKRHESCQQRLDEANKEIEKLKRDKRVLT